VEHLVHCFPVRKELVFESNTSCKSQFSDGDRKILLQTGVFSKVEEKHVFLGRNQSVLESGVCSTLFPWEN
jgi:hypothetical protein